MSEIKPPRNHVDVYFPPEDTALYNWLNERGKSGYNKNRLMRNALECLRLFDGSLETANNANEIAQLFGGNITEAQLAKCALAYLKERYPMQWQDILDGKEFSE